MAWQVYAYEVEAVTGRMNAVLASGSWSTNSGMIADVSRLYLRPDDLVVDVTFGLGKFWSAGRPVRFVAHDLDPGKGDGVDFRSLPESDGSVDVVVMDPAYVSPGGRATSTIADMNDRYGMQTTAKNPADQWAVIVEGLREAHRVLKPKGLIWLKCMDYVSSGRVQHCTRWAYDELDRIGFEFEDEFVFVGGTGPQPSLNLDGSVRRQVHARRNVSVLIVARKRPVESSSQGSLL